VSFVFSSRRRHTRFSRDWSSDVCSSDLALLGAANLRDIGYHFPDTDPQYKGIDSKELLKKVVALLRSKNYEIGNIDSTVCLQRPKVNPHIEAMQQCLAAVMGISIEDISIKATTTEQLGFVGREEGVSAYAVALVYKTA